MLLRIAIKGFTGSRMTALLFRGKVSFAFPSSQFLNMVFYNMSHPTVSQ